MVRLLYLVGGNQLDLLRALGGVNLNTASLKVGFRFQSSS